MSKKWPGGIITKNQATPTGPYENGAAPGIWTLNQMTYWLKQGLWPLAGNIEPIGQQIFVGTYNSTGNATQISYSFVVPSGVTSISAVCIGSGGSGRRSDTNAYSGRAGDLRWSSDIPVTPGETLTVLVAEGTGNPATAALDGTSSEIKRGATVLLSAVGGTANSGTSGTASSTIGGSIGGGNGGDGGAGGSTTYAPGGGGTGGYNGDGGSGMNVSGSYATTPAAGSGAAYGGDRSTSIANSGGGVNVLGLGTTAAAPQAAGSYGSYGSRITTYGLNGMYGAGGAGNDSASGGAGTGAPGAVRIIWGRSRTYPSNAADYLPLSASSYTQIELRFKQIYSGTNVNPVGTAMSELEILDETNTNIMRSPTVLTAVAGSNTLSFASLSNDQFGGNTSTLSATDAQTFNSGTVEATYISFTKSGSDTVSLLIKLAAARKIKQIKITVGNIDGVSNWFIPYIEVYGNGTLLGTASPVPTFDNPSTGNVTSTITFA